MYFILTAMNPHIIGCKNTQLIINPFMDKIQFSHLWTQLAAGEDSKIPHDSPTTYIGEQL
jgi:hypothetical protein